MHIRILRRLTLVAAASIALIMWYPKRFVFGIDLGNSHLQSAAFAVCMLLWGLSRGGKLRSDPYFEFRSGIWEIDAHTVAHNLLRMVWELVLLAGLLEAGQVFLTQRRATLGDFFANALGILAVGAVLYLLVAWALRSVAGKRLAQYFTTID